MPPYRVLSIDGGGIRGIITVILLERLSQDPALTGWLDKADLLAGTSTGGLLALGLARGVPLKTIRELYETKGKKIFDDSILRDIVDLGKIIGAKYDTMDPTYMEKMAHLVKKGRYLNCPNGSHMAMYDDQKSYFDGLLKFIADVDEDRFQ